MEAEIEARRSEIAAKMRALGRKLESGDDSDLLVWAIPGALACSHRPLRHHPRYGGSGQPIPSNAKALILDWVERMRLEGIASIVSFMHERDLRCYREIDFNGLDLPGFLQSEGFRVCCLPWEDPAHSKTEWAKKQANYRRIREEALAAYDQLVKPVLLMCSAGIDRSAPVAAYISKNRSR